MKLLGIDFGSVMAASGLLGFFGEGYWYHKLLVTFGLLSFEGMTFVSKTTTLSKREGNMPLKDDQISPKEFFPSCIIVKPFSGVVLNSVGLSGPGLPYLLDQGHWQKRTKPFFISFMSVAQTKEDRIKELEHACTMLQKCKHTFMAPFGLQLNVSCPNTGLDPKKLVCEIQNCLDCCTILDGRIPVMIKLNVLANPNELHDITSHKRLNAICVSNTIPFGQIPDNISWNQYFKKGESPLQKIGGGGLSGKPLFPLVCSWVKEFKDLYPHIPVHAGGGILKAKQLFLLKEAKADSVFIGSMVMLRPWRVKRTIRLANQLF